MLRQLKNWFHLLQAVAANFRYAFPCRRLRVIGVTGTDGKTTTVHLIYQILKVAGRKVDLISTVAAPGLHTTTPATWIIQRLLRQMVDRGVEDVVLEASSHGLDQNRLWGIDFEIGVVTNVTHDHLDYHGSYEGYLEAKTKLIKKAKTAILNRDDASYDRLAAKLAAGKVKLQSYGIKKTADFTPENFSFKTKLPGIYNQYNCLAAIAVCSVLGIEPSKIREGVKRFGGVVGRLEEIKGGQKFAVFVDFASTPNSLKNVLQFLKKRAKRKLWVVFGAAGKRDRQKRPMMGKVASQWADEIVLTAEDPRGEDVNKIIKEITQGCLTGKKIYKIPDRREAVIFAINQAKKGDVVVICGKGHEKSMCLNRNEILWSDQEEARKAIKNRLK
ncbi:MAG: UDP-N-acetylmuramoyl-L-alanyl-D-glutamate--2,6-diaminopimelate ligase [Candidatus Shapirobacteria bacterium]